MQVSHALTICLEYHKSNSRDNTLRAYQAVPPNFDRAFGEKILQEITSDDILSFLNRMTEGTKQQTRRTRYSRDNPGCTLWDMFHKHTPIYVCNRKLICFFK